MSNQPVPNPIIGSPVDDAATISTVEAAAAPVAVAKPTPQQRALQQQIQTQLQNQLQAQLQAAASRGKQANITPEMIQVRVFRVAEEGRCLVPQIIFPTNIPAATHTFM
jgi:translation elongation factor EF-Ts